MNQSTPELHGEGIDTRYREVDPTTLEFDVANLAQSSLRLDAFIKGALRSRVWGARRILSHGIDPAISFEDLLNEARSTRPDRLAHSSASRRSELVPAELVGAWWRALGRVVALQGLDATDRSDGLLLYDVARALEPVSTWSTGEALTYAQLCWVNGRRDRLCGDHELLDALDAEDRLSLTVDLAADADGVASAAWHEALERMLGTVPGVTVRADAESLFDGLRAISAPDPVHGPLVSVIMSAYRPGAEILTSAQSILDQSWRNLELLVVDDASGPEYADVLDHVAALDPRVRVLIQSQNRGTYAARNRALPETRGDFVTFQDSDDWSHPERIARQVQVLLDESNLPAVMSRSIRCTPNLELQLFGYRTTRTNVSSLMLRRSTIDTLGYFDPVRKGADSEYELRIAAHYGRRVRVMRDLLAFVRLDANSLSRSDFKPGWWHPARFAYRDGYRRWHEAIARGANPWLSPEATRRQFPAPGAFVRRTDHQPDDRPFDLVFVMDWREVGAAQTAVLQQLRAAATRGLRVGIMHIESLRSLDIRTEGLCREISDLQWEGVVTRVLLDDAVIVRRLVIGDPALLAHAPHPMSALKVHDVAVLAPTPPMDTTTCRHRYAPAAVSAMVEAVWGTDPVWIPAGETVRSALTATDNIRLATGNAWGLSPAVAVQPHRTRGARPIVGAVVGAGDDSAPATAQELLALVPDDRRFDVRLIAAPSRLAQLLGTVPSHWLIYRPDEITQRDFYRQIDFFVSSTGADRVDQVVPRVIDAVSAGAVAVIPPSVAGILGDAAVYAGAEQVPDVIGRLFVNPDEYAAAVARAQASVREQFSSGLADQEPIGLHQIDQR